jgi:hypothetical protein
VDRVLRQFADLAKISASDDLDENFGKKDQVHRKLVRLLKYLRDRDRAHYEDILEKLLLQLPQDEDLRYFHERLLRSFAFSISIYRRENWPKRLFSLAKSLEANPFYRSSLYRDPGLILIWERYEKERGTELPSFYPLYLTATVYWLQHRRPNQIMAERYLELFIRSRRSALATQP